MEKLAGILRVLPKDSSQKKEIVYLSENATIRIGAHPSCDIRIVHDQIDPFHFRIYRTAEGKVSLFSILKLKKRKIITKQMAVCECKFSNFLPATYFLI
jgi:hypothetical protein